MDEDLKNYRKELLDTIQKLNESYDKLVIALSGGALALSITFLKDVVGSNTIQEPRLLLTAWGLFVISLACVLGAQLFGIAANKKAVSQVDSGEIYNNIPGGYYSFFTTWLHYSGTILLVAGLISIAAFVYSNIGK